MENEVFHHFSEKKRRSTWETWETSIYLIYSMSQWKLGYKKLHQNKVIKKKRKKWKCMLLLILTKQFLCCMTVECWENIVIDVIQAMKIRLLSLKTDSVSYKVCDTCQGYCKKCSLVEQHLFNTRPEKDFNFWWAKVSIDFICLAFWLSTYCMLFESSHRLTVYKFTWSVLLIYSCRLLLISTDPKGLTHKGHVCWMRWRPAS